MSEQKHIEGPWRFVEREVMEDGSVYPQHIVGGPQELQVCLLEGPVVAEVAVKNNWPAGKPRSTDLLLAAPDLLNAVEKQHRAIDWLLALIVQLDPTFYPTKSAVWPLIVDASAPQVIAKATGAQS